MVIKENTGGLISHAFQDNSFGSISYYKGIKHMWRQRSTSI